MTVTSTDPLPEATTATVRAMITTLVANKPDRAAEGGILAVRARAAAPWAFVTHDGRPVHVVSVPSALAAREAIRSHRPGDWTVLLTDRDDSDLGAGVLVHLTSMRVLRLDPWESVIQLFQARQAAASFVAMPRAREVAYGLVRLTPAEGWAAPSGGVLTREHALDELLRVRLGLTAAERDLAGLVAWSRRGDAATALAALLVEAGEQLAEAVLDRLAEFAGAARGVVRPLLATGRPGELAALGVVVGLLTGDDLTVAERQDAAIALARSERWWHGHVRSADPALRPFGQAVARAVAGLPEVESWKVADEADALLRDIAGAPLAVHSDLLPTGWRLRADALGQALLAGVGTSAAAAVEGAWGALARHRLAERYAAERQALEAAVRLRRWLEAGMADWASLGASCGGDSGAALAALVRAQLDEAGWADAAINTAAIGVEADLPARGIEHVVQAAIARREEQARAFAQVLAAATRDDAGAQTGVLGAGDSGVVLIERLLDRVVAPLVQQKRPVLVVVLDGLSTAAGTTVAADAARLGWEEVAAAGAEGRRAAAVAVLPTLTEVSRASLFAGALASGGQDAERAALTTYVDRVLKRRCAYFPKKVVEATRSGHALAGEVSAALDDVEIALVAVVLNTIDDALDRSDPGGTTWTADAVKHLRPLLSRALAAGRTVVVTGDHGHIVERRAGHQAQRELATSGRSRAVGEALEEADEVLISGRRVHTPGGEAVLAVSERLRYGPLKAGYHGGAHPAEVVVPIIVLQPSSGPDGDPRALPPQEPAWWHGALVTPAADGLTGRSGAAGTSGAAAAAGRGTKRTAPPAGADTLFELVGVDALGGPGREGRPGVGGAGGPTAPASLGHRVVASATYAQQRQLAPRLRVTSEAVATLIDALAAGGGRLAQIPAAQALGVPVQRLQGAQEQVKQLLNVDGYGVLRVDADGVTLVLDQALLCEQFGVSRG